jgi:hypothetical protein
LKLPEFCSESPKLWFAQVNCFFATSDVTGSFDMFCHTVAALQHDALLIVADIKRSPPEDPFAALQARLLTSHRLTDYQRAEKLVAMTALGARRPSQLLAGMLEMCPARDEKSKILPALFLQRLPPQLRVLLTKDDLTDLVALAEHADMLCSNQQQDGVLAVVECELLEAPVVAAVSRPSGRGFGSQGTAQGKKQKPKEPEVSRQARLAASLCLSHWCYGKAAHACTQPCSWTGN